MAALPLPLLLKGDALTMRRDVAIMLMVHSLVDRDYMKMICLSSFHLADASIPLINHGVSGALESRLLLSKVRYIRVSPRVKHSLFVNLFYPNMALFKLAVAFLIVGSSAWTLTDTYDASNWQSMFSVFSVSLGLASFLNAPNLVWM